MPDLEYFAKVFREQAEQKRLENPDDPFAGHDYDDCANQIEMSLPEEV